MRLSLNEENIVWPGGLTQKPTGLMIPTHLKVLTILEKPFVYARQVERHQVHKELYLLGLTWLRGQRHLTKI